MDCPSCGQAMQTGEAFYKEDSLASPLAVAPHPNCWFRSTDGTVEAALVARYTSSRAFRCGGCGTVVIAGSGPGRIA